MHVEGVKLTGIPAQLEQAIAGLAGGIISLIFANHLSPKRAIATVVVSLTVAIFLGDYVSTHFAITGGGAGFVLGLSAMKLCAIIAEGDWLQFFRPKKDEH